MADEWRLVCDATHGVRVNNRTRVLDQIRPPAWPDSVAYLDEMAGDEMGMHFSVTFDVSKAHRRIPMVPTECGLCGRTAQQEQYQPTTIREHRWLFGVSSAGYWWSRLASLLLRVIYALLGAAHHAHILLFSDDGFYDRGWPSLPQDDFVVVLWRSCQFHFRGKKVKGGLEVWVGFWISVWAFKIGVSQKRQAWALEWCPKMASSRHDKVLATRLEEALLSLLARYIR